MTFKIKLSDLPMPLDEFKRRVEAHFERLVEYFHHIEGVKIDAQNMDLKPEQRRFAFPIPSEDELIERAIRYWQNDTGSMELKIDFQIEGPSLEEKKQALTAEVHDKEIKAIAKVIPLAKRRHWDLHEHDIRTRGPQSQEEAMFLDYIGAKRIKQDQINRWAAKHEHDIHDLTEETVDTYKIGGEFA